MANNCYNWMIFTGDKTSIDRLEKEAFGTCNKYDYFTEWVNSVVNEKTEKKFDPYAYGTRWFRAELSNTGNGELIVNGDSAWSPPIGMAQAFCSHFGLECEFEYEESGNDFGGKTTINSKGNVVEEENYSYREWRYIQDSDSAISNIIEDIQYDMLQGCFESLEDSLKDMDYLSKGDRNRIMMYFER